MKKKSSAQTSLLDEIFVDNFAGGGGASTGIELATGRPVNIAINHDPDAILMHKTNHPYTQHYCESVFDIDPKEVCAGRKVGIAWFSPDCKHFSNVSDTRWLFSFMVLYKINTTGGKTNECKNYRSSKSKRRCHQNNNRNSVRGGSEEQGVPGTVNRHGPPMQRQ